MKGRWRLRTELAYRLCCCCCCLLVLLITKVGSDWCDLETGYTTITDADGRPRSVYISVTRDGSVWLRAGVENKASDWIYSRETSHYLRTTILTTEMVQVLTSINYTDYCVLTDLQMVVQMKSGWHPSYLVTYNAAAKKTRTLVFKKNNRDCHVATNLTLTSSKQGLFCNGGRRHSCGMRHLPRISEATPTMFLKYVNLDPRGLDHWACETADNSYTFHGSYYHVYVKLKMCPAPTDSRMFGHESKMRPNQETLYNAIVLPDPLQTALRRSTVTGWQSFAKIISLRHEVFLQVWRSSGLLANTYTLVGQTFYHPTELRFNEQTLHRRNLIDVQKGDILGLYFPEYNPIAWSAVPCAHSAQHYRFFAKPRSAVSVGSTYKFSVAPPNEHACRHYSFTAVLANKTHANLVEDWICPTARASHSFVKFASSGSIDGDGKMAADSGVILPEPGDEEQYGGMLVEGNSSLRHGILPVHLLFMILGSLLLLLVFIGFISYRKAMQS